jgi:hypothetical protein
MRTAKCGAPGARRDDCSPLAESAFQALISEKPDERRQDLTPNANAFPTLDLGRNDCCVPHIGGHSRERRAARLAARYRTFPQGPGSASRAPLPATINGAGPVGAPAGRRPGNRPRYWDRRGCGCILHALPARLFVGARWPRKRPCLVRAYCRPPLLGRRDTRRQVWLAGASRGLDRRTGVVALPANASYLHARGEGGVHHTADRVCQSFADCQHLRYPGWGPCYRNLQRRSAPAV